MRQSVKAILFIIIAAAVALMLKPGPSIAGDIILSHNRGDESAVFFIENEPSLVINGFDLTPHAVQYPVALDAVSISVNRAVPGAHIDLVVYQDANGGSPADATLVHRQPVAIDRAGFHRFLLNPAAIVTEPVVWVGFYLPPGFRFNADTSGPSVLTYWAWAPGGAFNINSLASAPVLGPGDGTEPVGIDMQGIARITAELRTLFHQEMDSGALLGQQLAAQDEQDTSSMQSYSHCGGLLHDPDDISITAGSSFAIQCGLAAELEAPIEVVNPDDRLLDLQRAGQLYKLEAQIPAEQLVHGAVNTLPVPVTHCMSIQPGDLEQAVIAEARGVPERWHALPSVRFGDVVCAEITTASYLSYFLPRTASSPPNVNLTVGWTVVDPHPLECGLPAFIRIPAINTGQSWFSTASGYVTFAVENIHVRSSTTVAATEIRIETGQFGPGVRHLVVIGPFYVNDYPNDLHRLQVRVDPDDQVAEANEDDNLWTTEYVLSNAKGSDRCFNTAWLTATPSDLSDLTAVAGFCFVNVPSQEEIETSGREDRIVIRYSPACQIEFKRSNELGGSASERTIRGCTVRIKTEVAGQKATVRYHVLPHCATEGGFSYDINRSGYQLIIDHDRPTPMPTNTRVFEFASGQVSSLESQLTQVAMSINSAVSIQTKAVLESTQSVYRIEATNWKKIADADAALYGEKTAVANARTPLANAGTALANARTALAITKAAAASAATHVVTAEHLATTGSTNAEMNLTHAVGTATSAVGTVVRTATANVATAETAVANAERDVANAETAVANAAADVANTEKDATATRAAWPR